MIFINPWAFYDPDDILGLNPQDDEEAIGCICGVRIYNSISNFCMAYVFYIGFKIKWYNKYRCPFFIGTY